MIYCHESDRRDCHESDTFDPLEEDYRICGKIKRNCIDSISRDSIKLNHPMNSKTARSEGHEKTHRVIWSLPDRLVLGIEHISGRPGGDRQDRQWRYAAPQSFYRQRRTSVRRAHFGGAANHGERKIARYGVRSRPAIGQHRDYG